MKHKIIFVILLTSFFSCILQKKKLNEELTQKVSKEVDELISEGVSKIIIFGKSSPISYSMVDIYYQKDSNFYLLNLYQNRYEKPVKQRPFRSSKLINDIFTKNQEKIINLLNNPNLLDKDFSDGRSFYFRIIEGNLDIERTYCCGVNANIDVYNKAKELWELMGAFKLDNY